MKLHQFTVVVLSLLLFSCRQPQEEKVYEVPPDEPVVEIPFGQAYGIYGLKSGIIVRAPDKDHREEFYFDDYGYYQAKYVYLRFKGEKKFTLTELIIDVGSQAHYVSAIAKTYFTLPHRNLREYDWDSLGYINQRVLQKDDYKLIGKDTFAGKTCDIWETQYYDSKGRKWLYKGLILKEEDIPPGKKEKISLSIQENVEIHDSIFKVPSYCEEKKVTKVSPESLR